MDRPQQVLGREIHSFIELLKQSRSPRETSGYLLRGRAQVGETMLEVRKEQKNDYFHENFSYHLVIGDEKIDEIVLRMHSGARYQALQVERMIERHFPAYRIGARVWSKYP